MAPLSQELEPPAIPGRFNLVKNASQIDLNGAGLLVTGFLVALVTATATVRWLVGFVSSHNFSSFGWYRIILGSFMIAVLYFHPSA